MPRARRPAVNSLLSKSPYLGIPSRYRERDLTLCPLGRLTLGGQRFYDGVLRILAIEVLSYDRATSKSSLLWRRRRSVRSDGRLEIFCVELNCYNIVSEQCVHHTHLPFTAMGYHWFFASHAVRFPWDLPQCCPDRQENAKRARSPLWPRGLALDTRYLDSARRR